MVFQLPMKMVKRMNGVIKLGPNTDFVNSLPKIGLGKKSNFC
jgi:hypothetical protein